MNVPIGVSGLFSPRKSKLTLLFGPASGASIGTNAGPRPKRNGSCAMVPHSGAFA
jgi:hypothetical protein